MLRRLFDNPWTYFSLAGVLFVVLIMTQFEIRPPPRSKGTLADIRALKDRKDVNLVFIVIDTLRADRLHAYGYDRETSPVLDYLAETGVRFGRVVSQSSWTKSSMASLWTSTWPSRNGILRWSQSLPPAATMPAEDLQKAGFRTAGIWRNGWVAPNFGFDQGFETYLRPTPGHSPAQFQRRSQSPHPILGTDEDLTAAARGFLETYGNERFFLYLHYMDVHQYAYDEASAVFGTSYSDTYDNAIHWVDRNVGTLLRALQDKRIWNRTLVVVVSDHGEGFLEDHGVEGHARTLYREVAEVPWIIAFPFELQHGLVVDSTVANVDVWPTLFDLLGLPPQGGVDGRSVVPLIEASAAGAQSNVAGAPAPAERPIFAEIDRSWGKPKGEPNPLVAVSLGPYRMIEPVPGSHEEARDPQEVPQPVVDAAATAMADDGPADRQPETGTETTGKVELYDHRTDPWEKRDLAVGGTAAIPAGLKEALASYLATTTPPWGAPPGNVKLDEMELNQLRALGYVVK